MNDQKIQRIKREYPPGTRIRLNHMGSDPCPVSDGMTGTVQVVDDIGTLHCKFDNGRYLGVIPGEDSFSVIEPEESPEEENQILM